MTHLPTHLISIVNTAICLFMNSFWLIDDNIFLGELMKTVNYENVLTQKPHFYVGLATKASFVTWHLVWY